MAVAVLDAKWQVPDSYDINERELVISCLWVSAGFRQSEKVVRKHGASESTYSLSRKISHAVNAITSFSEVPLRLIFYVGMLIFSVSMLYAANLVIARLFFSQIVDGWTSVMVSVWVLGGLIIAGFGPDLGWRMIFIRIYKSTGQRRRILMIGAGRAGQPIH